MVPGWLGTAKLGDTGATAPTGEIFSAKIHGIFLDRWIFSHGIFCLGKLVPGDLVFFFGTNNS